MLSLREDGIIALAFDDGCEIGMPEINELLSAQAELMEAYKGDFVGLLIDARPIRSMTRSAMQRTVVHPVTEGIAAAAIVVGGPVSRVLGSFFVRLTKHPYPARLFRVEKDARAWLMAQLDKRVS